MPPTTIPMHTIISGNLPVEMPQSAPSRAFQEWSDRVRRPVDDGRDHCQPNDEEEGSEDEWVVYERCHFVIL